MNDTSPDASDEALRWLIALQEEPDDADLRARLDTWLNKSQSNRHAWAEAQRVWDLLGETRQTASFAGRPDRARARPLPSQPMRKAFRARLVILPLAAAMICLAILLQPAITIWPAADYETAAAETRDLTLDDGSVVHLAPGSAIDVAFEPGFRRVRLLSGEAFFEVTPNRDRPFQVLTGDIKTTVLGTAFDVRMTQAGVAVAVDHGKVSVSSPQDAKALAEPLLKGDWVRVGWGGQVERGSDDPKLVASWRNGILVVKDWPIGDVLDEIRRRYPGKIVLADASIQNQRITGVYALDDPIEALRAAVEVHGAHVRQAGAWLAVVSPF